MSKNVQFSADSKDFDGSSEITKICYEVINAFFNTPTINHKRVGKTQFEIDKMLKNQPDVYNKSYCIKCFVISTKTGECDILLPIKTSEDCFMAVNGDMRVIFACIKNLHRSIENIKEKKLEKDLKHFANSCDDKIFAFDEEWDKNCKADICYTRNCCYDKKIASKLKYNVSLIRSGSRDYNCVVSIDYIVWVEKLLELLKDVFSNNKIEEVHNQKNSL